MHTPSPHLLTGPELAQRWGRSEAVIRLYAAVGAGPRYVKVAGAVRFPLDEIQRFEKAHATGLAHPATALAEPGPADRVCR